MVIHGQGGDVPGIYPLGICRIPEPLEVGRIIDKNAGNSPLPRLMTGGYNDQTRPLRWPLKWRRIFFFQSWMAFDTVDTDTDGSERGGELTSNLWLEAMGW